MQYGSMRRFLPWIPGLYCQSLHNMSSGTALGHTQLETTMLYLHLTHKGQEEAYERLNTLRHGLLS